MKLADANYIIMTAVWEYCKSDDASQWESVKYDPL